MKINVDTAQQSGAFFVNFTHVRDGENYHTFIRLEDITSWESVASPGNKDRAKRWRLRTRQGDSYYTLSNFNEIMTTSNWYPRPNDGKGLGRVGDDRLYSRDEYANR